MSTPNVATSASPVNGSRKIAELSWDDFASGTLPESPVKKAWRDAVMAVAENAKAKLPQCTSRIASAVKIVLNGDVELRDDSTAQVRSQANGQAVYHIANGSCTCPDWKKAFEGWCKHRIAAAIYRRARAQVAQQLQDLEAPAQPTTPLDAPGAAIAPTDDTPVIPTPHSATWAVTEAPLSTCLKLRIGAVEWTHTVRASTEAELRTRLRDFRTLVQDMSTELNTLASQLEAAHRQLHAASNQPPTPPRTPASKWPKVSGHPSSPF